MKKNLQILGFDYKPTDEELKKRWKLLAKRFHPDRLSKLDEEERNRRENKFKDISRAYQELTKKESMCSNTFTNVVEQFLQDLLFQQTIDVFENAEIFKIINYQDDKYSFSLNEATEELEINVTESLNDILFKKRKKYIIRYLGQNKIIRVKLNSHNYPIDTLLAMTTHKQPIDTIIDESLPIYTILNIYCK